MLCKSLQMQQKKGECLLRGTHCKGNLVPSRKQVTHKLSETEGGPFGPKGVPRPLLEHIAVIATGNTMVVAYIKKERG